MDTKAETNHNAVLIADANDALTDVLLGLEALNGLVQNADWHKPGFLADHRRVAIEWVAKRIKEDASTAANQLREVAL
jgi:hypothetical protein